MNHNLSIKTIQHRFVKSVPENMEDGVLYISMEYCTAIHKCACGCGNEVVTPLSPVDWKLIFDGESVSLTPSIGNWNYACKSHYWIINNKIKIAERWSSIKINSAKKTDKQIKKKYYKKKY